MFLYLLVYVILQQASCSKPVFFLTHTLDRISKKLTTQIRLLLKLIMWYFWSTSWETGVFSSEYCSFPPSLSFQQCSILSPSGRFRGVDCFSGQPIDPIFKGIAVNVTPLKMGCSKTSVINYKYKPRNIQKEQKFHLYCSGSLILRKLTFIQVLMNFHTVYKIWCLIAVFRKESNVFVSRTRLNSSTPTYTSLLTLWRFFFRKDVAVLLEFFFKWSIPVVLNIR
jgi:hypothetical protein